MNTIDYSIIVLYLIVTLAFGLLGGRNIHSVREYAVGRRQFPTSVIVVALLATWFGGESTLGYTSAVYSYGIVFIVIFLANIISRLTIAYLIAPRMTTYLGMLSVGDIMERHFGLVGKVTTGLVGMIFCLLRLSAQIAATAWLFHHYFKTSYLLGAALGMGVSVLYVTIGGIRSVTSTDILQFGVLILGLPLIAFLGLQQVGGLEGLFSKLPASSLTIFPDDASPVPVINLFLIFSIVMLDPALIQRLLMCSNSEQIRRVMLSTAAFDFFLYLITGSIGLIAICLGDSLGEGFVLLNFIDFCLPEGTKGLAIVCLLAVFMSTADSALNTGSICFVHDTVKPLLGNKLTDTTELFLTKTASFFIGVAALITTLSITEMIQLQKSMKGLNIWAPLISVPVFLAIMGYSIGSRAFLAGCATSLLTLVLWPIFDLEHSTGFCSLLPAMTVSGLTILAIHTKDMSFKNTPLILRHKLQKSFLKGGFSSLVSLCHNQLPERLWYNTPNPGQYSPQYILFGCFVLLNYIVPYFFWSALNTRSDLSLTLWFIGGLLCGAVVTRDSWSKALRPFFPVCWHITLLYCLPFISSFMVLDTQMASFWLVNLGLALFLLAALVDWLTFIVLLITGMFLGVSLYCYTQSPDLDSLLKTRTLFLLCYISGLFAIIGVVFSRNRYLEEQQQYETLIDLGGSIANEMRAPLMGLHLGVSGLARFFPNLLKGYQSAKDHKLPVYPLSERQLIAAHALPTDFQQTIHRALTMIDMVMTKLKETPEDAPAQTFSMLNCIEATIETYPFLDNETHLVHWDRSNDFFVRANFEVLQHILFNLLKNALYQIHANDKGKILIHLSQTPDSHCLHFKDTAWGIPPRALPHIFDRFFTQTRHGTGVGLAFCKVAMEKLGGTIDCHSTYGEYAEFILKFPKITKNRSELHEIVP